ncbi:MAG: DUF1285 domain-containing protein [Gammaproteobacteria bacterium]
MITLPSHSKPKSCVSFWIDGLPGGSIDMSKKSNPLDAISDQLGNTQTTKGLPPVDQWNPPLSGDLDMQIRRDGSWWYLGTPIERPALVKLFASILKREGDDYFLVTPVEKWRIRVDDAPLLAVSVRQRTIDGQGVLEFETLTGDLVIADATHPIRVQINAVSGEPSPYVRVRRNLDALIQRSAFYHLVELAQPRETDAGTEWVVESAGQSFSLGRM